MNLSTAASRQLDYTILVLAGGAGRRMEGRDKGLEYWHGKPLVQTILQRMSRNETCQLISCNRNIKAYQRIAPVVEDHLADYQGPLAGIAAAMEVCTSSLILVLPCDCPEPPTDLYARLSASLSKNNLDVAYAWDGLRDQYLFALMKANLRESLQAYLHSGQRSVRHWYAGLKCDRVDFSDQPFRFRNINHLSELNSQI